MTILEQETMNAVKNYCNSKANIDWEQRRYEIAKELLVNQCNQGLGNHELIQACIETADLFIYELKKQKQ